MRQITMLVSMPGSPDGARVLQYPQGESFEVGTPNMPDDLANVFVENNWAEETAPENKALNPALEYKDMTVELLKEQAELAGIEGFKSMKKDELVDALEKKALESTLPPA